MGPAKYGGDIDSPLTTWVMPVTRQWLALVGTLLLLGCQTASRAAPEQTRGLVAAGAGHTCVVAEKGGVSCWGSNPDGQLGDGTVIDSAFPVATLELTGMRNVAAGSYHACALGEAGNAWCWGWNVGGQVGDGTNTNRLAPFELGGLENVSAIATGSYHSCALIEDGSARCWGQNDAGQLGSGSAVSSSVPLKVFSLPPTSSITAGGRHTCIRLQSCLCAARGRWRELLGLERARPARRRLDERQPGPGYNHTCAVLGTGELRCWGCCDRHCRWHSGHGDRAYDCDGHRRFVCAGRPGASIFLYLFHAPLPFGDRMMTPRAMLRRSRD